MRPGPALLLAMVLALVAAGCGADGPAYVSFNTQDGDPDWSAGGHSIAFATSRGGGGIYIVRPDGTGLRRVLRGAAGDVDWSPDGRQLAFDGGDGIYVLRLAGRRTQRILSGEEFSSPAWAPDGSRLAVVRAEEDFSDAIYVVPAAGGRTTRLLPRYAGAVGDARPGSPAAVSESGPAWSPDGREIAFEAGDSVLVVASVADGHRRTLASGASEPAWSPDGRLIAFSCTGDVCITSLRPGVFRRFPLEGGNPSWSPDSQHLVFVHYLYGGTGFFSKPASLSIVDANGENLRKLTYGPTIPPSS